MKIDDYNQLQIDRGIFIGEHLTELTEFWQKGHALKVDGMCGPDTLRNIVDNMSSISDADTDPIVRVWDAFQGPLDHLPRTRSDVYKIFGNPSNGTKVDKKWVKENIRTFRKEMALPGVPPHRYIKIHKLAEPYMREALWRATEACPDYEITKFACFNYRLMRKSNRLSYHSWGIAMDINPDENPAIRYKRPEDKPIPFGDEWHVIRPNAMPKKFVDAIKSVGFAWGGDWRTFADDMHFELVL
jgi:hypothetical protein